MSGRDTVGQPHVRPNQRLKPVHAKLDRRIMQQVLGADGAPYDAITAFDPATGRPIFVRIDWPGAAVWLAASLLKWARDAIGTKDDDGTRRELVALIRRYTGYTSRMPDAPQGEM